MRTICAIALVISFSSVRAADLVIEDIFGRKLNDHGLTLVDREGQIANPAIKFYLSAPSDAAFPLRVILTAEEPRACFNLPSTMGAHGPRKVVELKDGTKRPAFVSIFSRRESEDKDFVLRFECTDARGETTILKLPCRVIDQHGKEGKGFPIAIDFSHDRTEFFKDEEKRKVVTQAARDWMYFFEPVPLDPVPAAKEETFIWDPDGFKTGRYVKNTDEYTGYLLYVYGIEGDGLRSGGAPSRIGGLQSQKGKELTLRRSGAVEVETRGNYNKNGWLVSLTDTDCWKASNLRDVENDLYSIVHHEIGHALIFNAANPLFDKAKKNGRLEAAPINDYLGSFPAIDRTDHLDGTIDPESRRGAFGYEYHGEMPLCRWQITKLDLLCAQAIGYRLRQTSAFAPLKLKSESLPAGVVGKKYAATLEAVGGIPFYEWQIVTGALPDGLSLDSFTGAIRGTPTKTGTFAFTIRVRDYVEKSAGQNREMNMRVVAEK